MSRIYRNARGYKTVSREWKIHKNICGLLYGWHGGARNLYLASAFEEIWMQPVGMLSISGPSFEMPFAREALRKIGLRAEFFQREKYKSAMENFTNSDISKENEENLRSLIGSLTDEMIAGITKDRKRSSAEIKQQVDKGLLTGDEALSAGLIDRLDYPDVMLSEMREKATGNPEDKSINLVTLARYSQDKVKPKKSAMKRPAVALIYITGTIVEMTGPQGNAGADKISAAITEAYEDNDIGAIVLRVDSPGGSPSASETIRRSLVKAQEKGKKVYVSMGPVAASGGYWVATHADKIFALNGTVTGSIGVVMGKFEASELWKKIGVNWQGPQVGENADIWSINKPFDQRATQRINALIDYTYDAFLSRVSEGREIDKDQARKVAQGRAWTGQQAQKNGLVDEIGGLHDALDAAALVVGDAIEKMCALLKCRVS